MKVIDLERAGATAAEATIAQAELRAMCVASKHLASYVMEHKVRQSRWLTCLA